MCRRLSSKSAVMAPEEAVRLAREASIVGFETAKVGDCDDCGICLDAAEEVAIDGCDHMLCGACRERHLIVASISRW